MTTGYEGREAEGRDGGREGGRDRDGRGGGGGRRPFFRRRKSCPFSGPNAANSSSRSPQGPPPRR